MADYPHSFGAQVFLAGREGRDYKLTQQLSKRKIPGGDVTYLDDGGRESAVLTLNILLPDIASFHALAGVRSEQTLVLHEGAYRAVLAELAGGDFDTPDLPHQARATFEIVSVL